MHNFTYVSKKEAAPYKEQIIELIKTVQDEVREYFTFRFDFIGSSSRNMITREMNGNIGYDFDVNIEPNDPYDKYDAAATHTIIYEAIRKHMNKFGYSKIENSTSVITIKDIDRKNRRIKRSCDIAIVFHYDDGQQIYIRYNKKMRMNPYSWESRGNDYNIDDKLKWISSHNLKLELRERYLNYKNWNNNPKIHSRTIFARAVNDLCNERGYKYSFRQPNPVYFATVCIDI